ncbi:hypothetical protein [Mucilaginibacter pedocola]|uniref:Uncharacterized protein n=1 Tax=Mucilaginibacter pedocola TaxID=1792845 RepID=A0A1S9PNR4_9SPHI|nr:hypothetical protein [Mucilaginibacter pedocola]OOQ62208.1 hypothetical protein BC343_03965 [Mucilaginibacter pedocola]
MEQANTQNSTINYASILIANNGNLKDSNNHLDELSDLINALVVYHDDYFNISSFYYSKVTEALVLAKDSGIATASTVESQAIEFKKLSNDANNAFKAAINLPGLIDSKQLIRFSAKVL